MTTALGIPERSRRVLAQELAHVAQSFGLLLDALAKQEGSSTAAAVQHQLKWATIHIEAAIDALAEGIEPREPPAEATPAAAPAAPSPSAASLGESLRGHTQSISIAEILGFVASLRKSGTLLVHGPSENYLVELRGGAVVYAQGDQPPEGLRLGEILVAQGAMSAADLAAFLQSNPSRAKILGAALLEERKITEDALRIALAYQVQHLFHRMCAQTDATYQFEEDVHRIDTPDIRLNVHKLLLESARRRDERVDSD